MVPGLGEGQLVARDTQGYFFKGDRAEAFFNVLGGVLQLYRPIVAERLLVHTMAGYYVSAPNADHTQTNVMLQFGYGTPKLSTSAPVASDYQLGGLDKPSIRADFMARTVVGTIPFYTNGPTLASEIRDVAINADGTAFSGRVVYPDGSAEGTLRGFFVGPAGEEFIAQEVRRSGEIINLLFGARA